MSLLPRRGAGRHGQPDGVAVHPGWTLTPTTVTEPAPAPRHGKPSVTQVPASRWTSDPRLPDLEGATSVAAAPIPAQPVPVEPATVKPVPVEAVPVEAVAEGWAGEWEAVASTPASPTAPLSLHTAAVAAIDAVFGTVPAAWTAPPVDHAPAAHPAPFHQVEPLLLVPRSPALTALDLPLPPTSDLAPTPLAAEAARAMQLSSHAPTSRPPSLPPPTPVRPLVAASPARPSAPPVRVVAVPAAAQRVVDRAIRSAPTTPPPRRSTVRLGFTDASVIDLRPDDPIAKALHTVAVELMSRS